jgi:lactose/L-arabinose transport system permease protein
MNQTGSERLQKGFLYLLLIVGLLVSIGPFIWMFLGATKASGEIFSVPPLFLPGTETVANFIGLQEQIGFTRVLFNSLFIALTYTLLSVFICSLAGYAFAKYRFRGREVLFSMLLLAIMIPYQVTLVPLFEMMGKWNLINTYWAVILPHLAHPFGIFLMRQNMAAIPDALLEAARVDGCGEFRIFFTIALPTMRPAMAALAIFMFMFQWNNFMWPLIALTEGEMYTLPVALSSLIGMSRIDYGQLMMGTTLSTIPIMIFFLLLQRHFIAGILGGSVKG